MAANAPEQWRWTTAHGQRLKEARLKKGFSQKKAATVLGVSDDTLRNWENGTTQPREESLAAVAEFCGVTLGELVRLDAEIHEATPPAPAPPVHDGEAAPAAKSRNVWATRLTVTIVLAVGIVAMLALWAWRQTVQFHEIRPYDKGIESITRSGRVLWRAPGVTPSAAERWTLVRGVSGRTLVATILARPGDFRPEAVSRLSLIQPSAKRLEIVRTVDLPSTGWRYFPAYSRRYDPAYINAVDLDGDGVNEVLATYQQVPECVSYTVLYEPAVDRARIVTVHTGAHHFTGAWDLDGDGRREVVFLGINNGYNWMNALFAIRLKPRIRAALWPDTSPIASPDATTYIPAESSLVFYTLLPRGRVPDDPTAVSWDARRRLLTVRLLNGRVASVTALGFLAGSGGRRPEVERAAQRRDAYRHNREARRLLRAGFTADAVTEARRAVSAAEASGDRIVLEALERDLAKMIIAAGQAREGEALGLRLAKYSENASEIYYDLAVAFHLAGDLRRAVAYYELGIRRGGSPEAGKSKHEFIQGETLALVELGAFAEAEGAINRFRERYVTTPEDWSAIYREFVRWRKGEIPDPSKVAVPPNATDLQRYWMLEFANANGQDPGALLRAADALLAEGNRPRAALLSLRAMLLDRLGRQAEAVRAAREAILESEVETKTGIIARGHGQMIMARFASLSGGGA